MPVYRGGAAEFHNRRLALLSGRPNEPAVGGESLGPIGVQSEVTRSGVAVFSRDESGKRGEVIL